MAITVEKKKQSSGKWLSTDQYMNYQKPNTDRDTWTKSNPWSFGAGRFDVKFPKKEFDASKCPECGGLGRIYVDAGKSKRRRVQRSVPCPLECEYTVHW